MVYDTILKKHEDNGGPDGGTESTLPFRTCGCCCCSHLNDHRKKSSCHNHDRISRTQNSKSSKPCHNSTKYSYMRFRNVKYEYTINIIPKPKKFTFKYK